MKFPIFLTTLLLNKIFKFQICFYNNDNRLILSVVNIRDNWIGFGLFDHMWVYFFSFICIRLESNYCYLKIIPLTNLRLNWLRSNKTHVISNQHHKIKVVVVKTHLKFEFWKYLAGNILGFFDWKMYVLMLFPIFKKIWGGLYETKKNSLRQTVPKMDFFPDIKRGYFHFCFIYK